MPKYSSQEHIHDRGICPITFHEATEFVRKHHSYLAAPRGCLFCVAAFEHGYIVAVAIVGRPISRSNADGVTAEITRLCTHKAMPNTATALIARVVKACRAIGYHRVITYVDAAKDGATFKAANFTVTAEGHRVGWHGRDFCVPVKASPTAKRYTFELSTWKAASAAAKLRRSRHVVTTR